MTTAATGLPPRLRRLPLPVAEPFPALRLLPRRVPHDDGQEMLALDLVGAGDGSTARVTAPPTGTVDTLDGHPACLPEPRAWATRFVQAAVEVGAGLRPPGQLLRWASSDVHATLSRRHQIAARMRHRAGGQPGSRARVRTVFTCCPRPGAVEVSAVVNDSQRVRAVAMRMEGLNGRWRVTAFELG